MLYRVSHALVCALFVALLVGSIPKGSLAQAPNPPKPGVNQADEAAILERILNRVRFENDGTEVSETEAVMLIQSQAGCLLYTSRCV